MLLRSALRVADPAELLKLANGRRADMPGAIAAVGGGLSRGWPGGGDAAAKDERRRLVAGSFRIGWEVGQALVDPAGSAGPMPAGMDRKALRVSLQLCPPAVLLKDAGPAAGEVRDRLVAAAGSADGLAIDSAEAAKVAGDAFTLGLGLAVVSEGAT